jgi:hypothetical protein
MAILILHTRMLDQSNLSTYITLPVEFLGGYLVLALILYYIKYKVLARPFMYFVFVVSHGNKKQQSKPHVD